MLHDKNYEELRELKMNYEANDVREFLAVSFANIYDGKEEKIICSEVLNFLKEFRKKEA